MNRLELSARFKVREGKLDGFEQLVADIISRAKQKDPGTIRFDWFLSKEKSECEVREEYVDPQAFVQHKINTAEATNTLFSDFADDHRVSIYGDPPPPFVERVEQTPMGKTVTWYRFFQGLGPEPASFRNSTPGFEVGAHMTVRPRQAEGFRNQAAEMLRQTREKDTRTLRYDWFLSRDGLECDVREAYLDAQGLIEHSANIFEARNFLFENFADNHFMTMYGEATQPLLDLFKAVHMQEHSKWFVLLGGLDHALAIPAGR